MHAVVTRVTIHDREQAEGFLRDQLVPHVSQAEGFVAGYWVNLGGDKGAGMTIFESDEAAKSAVEGGQRPPDEVVTIDSMDVAEVVANA